MKKVLAGIGTLAFGLTLAAGSALAQSQTYPMGISSPAFGPGVPGATPPAAATTNRARRDVRRIRLWRARLLSGRMCRKPIRWASARRHLAPACLAARARIESHELPEGV